jgi:hypothetical protein
LEETSKDSVQDCVDWPYSGRNDGDETGEEGGRGEGMQF